ncbi:MAG: ABC transporter substrate-binding protein [Desulfovermiculus sp.]|nr:ABC transporter substrate-binding protein [Desulfovermiculus sp.]
MKGTATFCSFAGIGKRLLYVVIVVGVLFTPHSAHANDPLVLGLATSLSSLEGRESYKAAQMAVDEINSWGGVQIGQTRRDLHIESVDLGGHLPDISIQEAVSTFEHFIQTRHIDALIVGPFRSEVFLAALDVLDKYKVPMISSIAMSHASEYMVLKNKDQYKYHFRTCLDSKYLANYLVEVMKFLQDTLGCSKVSIMIQDVAWARTTASLVMKLYLQRSEWTVVGLNSFSSKAVTYASELKEAKARGADIILAIFDSSKSIHLVHQWSDMNSEALLFGFISPLVGSKAWSSYGEAIAGTLNLVFELGNIPSLKYYPSTRFYNAYKRAYGQEIQSGHGPAPSYEAVYILKQAIEKTDSLDPDILIKAIEHTDRLGVMGRVRFHQGHQVVFGQDPHEASLACVFQWTQDGERKVVYPPSIAEGEIIQRE